MSDDLREMFKVGDIISIPTPHPTLPKELENKFFRVEEVAEHGVRLSKPYVDAKCSVPYRAKPPKLRNGRIVRG
jgi:arylsulfatase A-like enzyme